MINNDAFTGTVDIEIVGRAAAGRGQQVLLKDVFAQGTGATQALRFRCHVAEETNRAFTRIKINRVWYTLNPSSKAQFGRNERDNAYLTVGVVSPDGDRLRITWEGDDVPVELQRIAVRHDLGRDVDDATVSLDLSAASVWVLGEKSGVKREDNRRNHDTGPDGLPYPRPPRRHHNRLCDADVRRAAARQAKAKKEGTAR